MCGRFTLEASKELIASKLNVYMDELEPSYNIAPTQDILAIVGSTNGRRAGYLQWGGLIPNWAKDTKIGSKMINARSETVDEKPAFTSLLARRRCLIVADSFYEWKRIANEKQPYRITVNNGDVFTFAGLWDRWESDGEEIVSCTILTTQPNNLMGEIHDRMPVILDERQREMWLDPTLEDKIMLKRLLTPYDSNKMDAYPVSKKVNNSKYNDSSLIQPITI
ncbi:hypothetical protein JCM21714_4191 [Gracilibacillus boraciitolerans JCM 21714]|uniref:Abasic site processing protein n=1 Tax=Gracilibacillus boraciitolerans JCM 21714 TaxID=1298598 RepID=W4VQ80_9BACI|nr:SOS response-associated peptidase [Gracilibacillus boraciitolerans]GAE94988.1 hypothetical protein JCM21714_4191 [Gracilibacillus boraciitolerans JCM 21714]